jgi:lipopolysaccharide biosynthesis protein
MWDNSPRRKVGATIFTGSTPEAYEQWLATVLNRFRPRTPQENFVFINAWNEWAEGNHLEPDTNWGRQYLEATKRALQGRQS